MRSAYFNTPMGQFEYWLLTIMRTAFQRNLDKWPSTYYGGLNAIDLYLNHESYSPFLQQPECLTDIMVADWTQDTADYVAEQLRRQRDHEPRQVLVQELVWCEECGAKPAYPCTLEASGVTTLPHDKRLARYRSSNRTDMEMKATAKNLNALRLPSLELR